MNQYIHYKCKHCGKQYKILEQWGDLKPKRCSGKKGVKACGVSFERKPEMLDIKKPKRLKPVKKEIRSHQNSNKQNRKRSKEDVQAE